MINTTLPYAQDIGDCLADTIGSGGLTNKKYEMLLRQAKVGMENLKTAYANGSLPLLHLPEKDDDLAELVPVAEHYRRNFKDVVILGTGGSSLGGRALFEMATPKVSQGEEKRTVPNLHIVTNVDPFVFEALIEKLNPETTGIIAISKSGSTTETVMQFLAFLPKFRDALGDEKLPSHFTIITEPGKNPMRDLAERFDLPVLDHDPKVGGRYSVLSLVGMLPAMIVGLVPQLVRKGAEEVLKNALEVENPRDCPAAVGAAISVGLELERKISSSVMLAYSDRLGSLARWYRQLWAESLGKNGKGTTPIYATGPVDQHSQLQLWLDGPSDKMFTVLGGPVSSGGSPICADLAKDPKLSFMVGRTMGELMEASRRATAETLAKNGKPVRRLTLDEINEYSMGALMMHFMLETILAADMLDVDPYDQPAVEEGKILIRQYMTEMGESQ
ncbi:glucose-6-phosphate isomerase [Curvivirga aplysinae]|uniref:glucose-6-phosphate isomerase n=1 Tax=Curvivirga aplysinae TaxID=2529852 RepID=UPI0012BD3BEA|nr:glucose-6-phosphate isomerase [Curvivirga aplysinae]MTI09456.1 glucose-6-phosphate isomerase [Curvivirga aplysinae]